MNRQKLWVQNAHSIVKMKKVVQLFVSGSEVQKWLLEEALQVVPTLERRNQLKSLIENAHDLGIPMADLEGKAVYPEGAAKSRSNQLAWGLVQLVAGNPNGVPRNKKKIWTDEWTAENFVIFAVVLGFLSISQDDLGVVQITEFGQRFADTMNSNDDKNLNSEEKTILKEAFATYPPAVRILELLLERKRSNPSNPVMSKFEIGHLLGFSGEPGFTSFDNAEWFEMLHDESNSDERKKIRQDVEGTADKAARDISSWMLAVGLVNQERFVQIVDDTEEFMPQGFKITLLGEQVLKRARGNSSNGKTAKNVDWRMLATKTANADYVKVRRSYTLKALQATSSRDEIVDRLEKLGLFDGLGVLEADISGLRQFGLLIEKENNGNYILKDRIRDFSVPAINVTEELKNDALFRLKNELQNELTNIDPRDVEIIELAQEKQKTSSKQTTAATLFETKTVELMKKYMKLNGVHLGGPKKPDGFLYFGTEVGIILDTKMYSKGYDLNINQRREMQDYIFDAKRKKPGVPNNEWWKIIPNGLENMNLKFMWVAGDFTGRYLEGIDETHNKTEIDGAAVDIPTLLRFADRIASNDMDLNQFSNKINNGRMKI
ncbi:hypothetical protein KGP40_10640 [Weissella cibaria]|uniref:restriction endonuclease FokI C-terminal domain-containing protein n=1 Tax=Weissella cibaria TaxID=137591 RepID=UPI001C200BE9|nr:restriction endonuclease FokI C-terminal domain-containing protein [Weissella cibaria]MBU7562366.1 hypothetical protein [Weissella cibaria]